MSRVSFSVLVLSVALAACDTAGENVEVVAYTGPEITEEDALIDDGLELRGWSGITLDGRTSLARSTNCGDECGATMRLVFRSRGADALPSFVEATFDQTEYLPERRIEREIELDRIEIQDWGPTVYSGVAYPVPQDDLFQVPIVFWTDDVAVAATAE